MEHSKGPWEVETPNDNSVLVYIPDGDPDSAFDAFSIFDADGNQVAIIPIDPYLGSAIDANARLMATAPQLLAAVENLLMNLPTADAIGEAAVAIGYARDIVAKAKGETT